MEHDAEPATVAPVTPAPDEIGLPDLSSVRAAALFHTGENAFAHALLRLRASLGSDANTPLLAGFGNFAPQEPQPHRPVPDGKGHARPPE